MVCSACISQVLAGCEDTPDHLDFAPRTVQFSVSHDSKQWRGAPPGYRAVVCAGPQAVTSDCCSPPTGAVDCQRYPVTCDEVDNFCALAFDVEIEASVDLLADLAMIASDGRVFSKVALVEMSAKTANPKSPERQNSLPIRSASLYIGPKGVGSSASPEATLVAEVPLDTEPKTFAPTVAGQEAFSRLARDYRTQFSWLLSAHFVVLIGTLPQGEMTVDLSWRARGEY